MSTITVTVSPPDAGHTSLVVYGQLYSCAYGSTISVPDFVADVLAANGWSIATASQQAVAVQVGSSSQKGIVQVDGSTITASAGVISAVGGGGGLTGFTGVLDTTAPNDTVNASVLEASGGTTDQDAIVLPKGTGAVALLVADGGAGGNKRGAGAVDLQTSISKGSPTTVASGLFAYCEGNGNTASGITSHAEGQNTIANATAAHAEGVGTTASGLFSHAEGDGTTASNTSHAEGGGTTASGLFSHAEGLETTASGGADHAEGANTVADGGSSHASGQDSWTRGIFGAKAHSTGYFAIRGDRQVLEVGLKGQTTDATPLVLTADGSGADITNQLALVDNETCFVDVYVLGKVAGASDCIAIQLQALIQRGTGAASTAIPTTTTASPAVISTYATAGAISGTWGMVLSADTTNGALSVTVTGAVSTRINWTAEVRSRELVF